MSRPSAASKCTTTAGSLRGTAALWLPWNTRPPCHLRTRGGGDIFCSRTNVKRAFYIRARTNLPVSRRCSPPPSVLLVPPSHAAYVRRHGPQAPRSHRPQGQSPLPRHHELRPADERGRRLRHHGQGARARDQLLRHRRRVRLEEGRGLDRADPRALVRAGQRPPRAHGARHQGVRGDGRLAQRVAPLGGAHPPRVRGLAPAPADRSPRPLPDAPRRSRHAVGGDLAGDGGAGPAGQGRLRRLVELRGLAHRAGQRGREGAPLPRARERAEPLQPVRSHHRARGDPGVPGLWSRPPAVEPVSRPARWAA